MKYLNFSEARTFALNAPSGTKPGSLFLSLLFHFCLLLNNIFIFSYFQSICSSTISCYLLHILFWLFFEMCCSIRWSIFSPRFHFAWVNKATSFELFLQGRLKMSLMLTSRCFYYMIFMSYWFCTGKKMNISKGFIFKILHWPTQLVQNQKQYQYITPRRLNKGRAICKNILLLITLLAFLLPLTIVARIYC